MTAVGYIYNAAFLCADDARELGIRQAHEHGYAMSWGDCGDAEETLSAWASMIGLDRDDETTFTSHEFPKRVTQAQAERAHGERADNRCSTCGWNLAQPF